MHETLVKDVIERVVNGYEVLIPIRFRVSEEWRFIANKILAKPPAKLSPFDKELLALTFETWKDNVREKVLVFVDEDGEFHFKNYVTRFTDEKYVKKLLAKYNHAWKKATEEYDTAVFVTITLPPIIPLYIQKYAMSFLWHRIKAYLRKHYGFTPHIYADEPQKSLSLHRHGILFGIPRIMGKHEFTRWLDDNLINFFKDMGHHIKKTVNNRLTEDQVKVLNKLGKKLLKRYLKYKRKHPKYQGPVNYLCKLVKRENRWEWENLPPDYLCYLEELQKKRKRFFDGASISPSDYIKKYLIKNLNEIMEYDKSSKDSESKSDDGLDKDTKDNDKDEKKRELNPKLAWYWLCRTRFYSVSPKFRMKSDKKPKRSLKFVFCTTKDELNGFLRFRIEDN